MDPAKINKPEKKEVGESCYLNRNCWLVRNLNYSPYNRCQYCEFGFNNCLFMQYQAISLLLVLASFLLFLFYEKKLSWLVITTVFTLVIVYGYFFNSSTEKIIKSNFFLKKTKNSLKDLTDNLEEKVNEQTRSISEKNRNLQELLNMKNDFLRVVSHQLNTPITVISAALYMLDKKRWSIDKSLDVIKIGFHRITETVQDFRAAYELDGEDLKIRPEKTNITEIVESLIPEKQKLPLVYQRKLSISVNNHDFAVPDVWCDPKKITHVISNLLDNAIYYTEKGSITVSYAIIDGKDLKLSVIDTGVGISDEDKKVLFQKFSRGRAALTLRPDGSGLGLYISKKIVESNDGKTFFESAGPGKGSVFSFTVPIYQNQQADDGKDDAIKKDKIVIFAENKL